MVGLGSDVKIPETSQVDLSKMKLRFWRKLHFNVIRYKKTVTQFDKITRKQNDNVNYIK